MNRQDGTRSRNVALEVCQRTNSKAVVSGTIAALGHEYLVSLEALNCRENGEVFGGQQVRAANKEGVLDALSAAASGLRRELGESLVQPEFDAPLREATTPSLDASRLSTPERNSSATDRIPRRPFRSTSGPSSLIPTSL